MLWQKWHWHHSSARTPLNLWSRCFNSQMFHCFALQNLGEHLEEEEIEGLLDEADEGEGIIIYSEFCDIKNLNWAELNTSHLPFHALHFMAHDIFTVNADLQVIYMQFVSLILMTESVCLSNQGCLSLHRNFPDREEILWGTFSGSTLSDWLPFRYGKAAKEKCQLVEKAWGQID